MAVAHVHRIRRFAWAKFLDLIFVEPYRVEHVVLPYGCNSDGRHLAPRLEFTAQRVDRFALTFKSSDESDKPGIGSVGQLDADVE